MQARDLAGNVSTWATGSVLSTHAFQETPRTAAPTLAYTGTWTASAQDGAYGGSVRYAEYKSGADTSGTFTFTGRGVAVAMPRRAELGTVRLCLDSSCSSVDLSPATGLGPRKLVFARSGLSPSVSHKLVVTATGGRADLDALVVLK